MKIGPKEHTPTPDNETFKLKFQFYNQQVVNDFLNHKFFFPSKALDLQHQSFQ